MFGFTKKEKNPSVPAETEKVNDQLSLTEQDQSNIRQYLKENGDIEIAKELRSVEQLLANGFHKVDEKQAKTLYASLGLVPQIFKASELIKNAGTTTGFYKVVYPSGLHLTQSRVTSGAFRAMAFNSNNRLAAQAELIPVSNTAALAPDILSNLQGIQMAGLAIVVMQTLNEIDTKLDILSSKIDEVQQFLETEQRSRFRASCQELQEIINRIDYLMGDPIKAQGAVDQLHDIQRKARESMNFCQEQLAQWNHTLQNDDSLGDVTKKLNTLHQDAQQYRLAVYLYNMAVLLETQLLQVSTPEEMEKYQEPMRQYTKQFQDDFDACRRSLVNYFEQNNELNGRTMQQVLKQFGNTTADNLLHGVRKAIPAIKASNINLFGKSSVQVKADYVKRKDDLIQECGDLKLLESPITTLSNYVRALNGTLEIVCAGGDYYTNLIS